MLVLTRKSGESIHIGEDIRVTILSVQGQSVKVGILAPRELAIHREEIYEKIVEENQLAASRASLKRAQMLMEFNQGSNGNLRSPEAEHPQDEVGATVKPSEQDETVAADFSEPMMHRDESVHHSEE